MNKKIKKTTTTTVVTEEEVVTNDKTHIICILDRSGSMYNIMDDSIGGFNEFLKKQKELPGEATITVALFDHEYELIYDCVDIKKAESLTNKIWFPRGATSLYDAIGKTINNEKATLNKLDDNKPSKVLVCIITDGKENNSVEYDSENIKKLIGECEKDNWTFIYLAANQDGFLAGSIMGVCNGNILNYKATTDGVTSMYSTFNATATLYRTSTDNSTYKNLINSDDKKVDKG